MTPRASFLNDRGVIARWRDYLPVSPATPVISLNEGSTPLIHCPRLDAEVGRGLRIYLKFEGLNPTGSFKDRGMTMAISRAVESGASAVICASTGNTSASAAAYAARAGIACSVLLPAGKIAQGKLVQSIAHGARIIEIDGNFDDALQLARDLAADPANGVAIVNSVNPFRLEGQKTVAFEIIDDLGDAPDIHLLPVGNAGNISAAWMGYREFHRAGRATRLPRMGGFQAAGSAPIFYDRVIAEPKTHATAIAIGNPASWTLATAAVQESRGDIDIVSDDEIFAAQRWLASSEGIFVEPASAASVAGLMKWARSPEAAARLPDASTVVCTVTGHGLKDPDAILSRASFRHVAVKPHRDAVLAAIRES